MKIVLSAILTCLLLSSCSTFHQGKNFSMTIKMDSALAATKQKVYLYESIGNEWSILDSALICNNKKKVKLEGKIPFQYQVNITFEKEGPVKMPIIVTPKDKITIKLSAKSITDYNEYRIDIPNKSAHHEYYEHLKYNRKLRIGKRNLIEMLSSDSLKATKKKEIKDSIEIYNSEIKRMYESLVLSNNPFNANNALIFLSIDYHCIDKYKDYLLKKFPDYPPIKESYELFDYPKLSPKSKIIEVKIKNIQSARREVKSNKKDTVSANKGDTLSIMLHKDDGSSESLNKYRGKYVLVEFWASWCAPCLRAMPKLIEAKNKFAHGLSTGQKQRILIARAVYKNPEYIFLDEATNSLDANNERAIMDKLNVFLSGRTAIIIAHRLSTVRNADNIVVLQQGKIKEQGTHRELINQKGIYYNLVKNQLDV